MLVQGTIMGRNAARGIIVASATKQFRARERRGLCAFSLLTLLCRTFRAAVIFLAKF